MVNTDWKKRVLEALDFWYTMDFLNQERIPKHRSRPDSDESSDHYHFEIGNDPSHSDFDLRAIRNSVLGKYNKKGFEPPEEGRNYLFVGKVPREPIVQFISKRVSDSGTSKARRNQYREREIDSIAVALLQFDESGRVIPESFQLSPIVWAAHRLELYGRGQEGLKPELFSPKQYKEDCDQLADELQELLDEGPTRLPVLREWIAESIAPLLPRTCRESGQSSTNYFLMDFCMYKNREGKSYVQNLGHGFFTKDIMRIRQIVSKTDERDLLDGPLRTLCRYIAPVDTVEESAREENVDLLEDAPAVRQMLHDVVRPERTPLGRWPSRYPLSFMQQAAVNLSTSTECFQNIMSVNGPPGTGKTTLLKDIIAATVIERAKRLAKYAHPDEAFECVYEFAKAHRKQTGEYCYNAPNVFKLKDDSLNDLSILVCSTNNAAVENISLELPQKKLTLDSILEIPQEIAPEKEREIRESNSGLYESRKKFEELDYFSNEANALYGSKETEGAHVLLAARLGKMRNIGSFNYHAIYGVRKRMLDGNSFEEHKEKYKDVRENFLIHYERVKELQNKYEKYYQYVDDLCNCREMIALSVAEIEKAEMNQETLLCEIQQQLLDADAARDDYLVKTYRPPKMNSPVISSEEECEIFLEELIQHWDEEENNERERQNELKSKKEDYKAAGKELSKQEKTLFGRLGLREEKIKKLAEKKENAFSALENKEKEVEEASKSHKQYMLLADSYRQDIIKKMRKLKETARLIQEMRRDSDRWEGQCAQLEDAKNRNGAERHLRYPSLDEKFFSEFYSEENPVEQKQAHQFNPASFPDLDRARERLFIQSLELLREFVLASKCMESNLTNLYAMWGGHVAAEKEGKAVRIRFDSEARALGMPVVLQSLFLLTPVISSTFASVGTMFRDVEISARGKAPFGILVVDEAGQAVPYAALGALSRCRRAIVVGDPNQVEPVVKSDLKLLRDVWRERAGDDVVSASWSVQHYADQLNKYGSRKLGDGLWMGCPLLIHHRCISPIFDISNEISYNGRMLNDTKPKSQILTDGAGKPMRNEAGKVLERFSLPSSCWINVGGLEKGDKEHYVHEQGARALSILERAFENSAGRIPDIFVISPFKTVAQDFKAAFKKSRIVTDKVILDKYCSNYIGTVHTFQGKGASEVIFLLGCGMKSLGAVQWVTPNIVNVAASRAKQRLYVIGNIAVWKKNKYVEEMKKTLDRAWCENYKQLQQVDQAKLDDARARFLQGEIVTDEELELIELERRVLCPIPTDDALSAFGIDSIENDDARNAYRHAIAKSYIKNVSESLSDVEISDDLARVFGFGGQSKLNDFLNGLSDKGKLENSDFTGKDIGLFIKDGIIKYDAAKRLAAIAAERESSIAESQEDLAVRDCLSRFSFATELMLKIYCVQPIREIAPSFLSTHGSKFPTIGAIAKELGNWRAYLGVITEPDGSDGFGEGWWGDYSKNVGSFNKEQRNPTMHVERKLGLADCDIAIHRLFTNEAAVLKLVASDMESVAKRLEKAREDTQLCEKAEGAHKEFNKVKGERLYPKVIKRGDGKSLNEKKDLLQKLSEKQEDEQRRRMLEWQIENEKRGANGERETSYELENSFMPIYILQDLIVEQEGFHGAQIDLLVITPQHTVVIECKNYSANIEIDHEGVFRRRVGKKSIPFYSPIKQNEHHIDVMQELLDSCAKTGFSRARPESLVVFANREADIDKGPEADGKRPQVVRVDQVNDAVKQIDEMCKGRKAINPKTKADMEARVAFWLEQHKRWLEQHERDALLDVKAETWLEDYRKKFATKEAANTSLATGSFDDQPVGSGVDVLQDGQSCGIHTQVSAGNDIDSVEPGDQEASAVAITLTAFLSEWRDDPKDDRLRNFEKSRGSKITAQIVNKDYLSQPELGFLEGETKCWSITEKGKEKLGMREVICEGSDGPYTRIEYSRENHSVMRDILSKSWRGSIE